MLARKFSVTYRIWRALFHHFLAIVSKERDADCLGTHLPSELGSRGIKSVDEDAETVKLVQVPVEVLVIFRVASIKVPKVVYGHALTTFIHLFYLFASNVKVHDSVPVILIHVWLSAVNQTFPTTGFWGNDGLVLDEDCAALTAPIPEVFLDHGKYKILVGDRCVLWI